MNIPFSKYQGTGNDFVIIDNREHIFPIDNNQELIERLCHRKFGVGADGLILLANDDVLDFKMIYYNADGRESSMCGNGGRCVVAFAQQLGIFETDTSFNAIDGLHEATIKKSWIELKMADVNHLEENNGDWILDTGSPHYVSFVNDFNAVNVFQAGRKIRYNDRFNTEGINVNFMQWKENALYVATYERGVEDETLSCGTGVTAAALVFGNMHHLKTEIPIITKGGHLSVRYKKKSETVFSDIWLCGPAIRVFNGVIDI